MRQVIQSARSGKLALRDVPAPQVAAGSLLVQTRASLISAGTEKMVIDFARKSLAAKAKARPDLVRKVLDKAKRDGLKSTFQAVMARLDEPMPLGYSAAGRVVAVGAGLEGLYRVGDRVAVAGAGLANHADLNVVPRNLAAPVPDGVSDEEACFGTLGAIALHGVRNLTCGLGDVVGVLGVGLLGQIAVRLLSLAGCRVVALDYDPSRLDLAKAGGAELALNLADGGVEEAVFSMTRGLGCDGILIAAATKSSEPLLTAANIARDRAKVSMVGMTGTEFPYREFMQKELSLMVSRSYGPGRYDDDFEGRGVKYPAGWVRWTETENLAEVVRLMNPALPRRLDVAALTTHRFDIDQAEQAYAMITGGAEPHLGVVLTYGEAKPAAAPKAFPAARTAAGDCVMGVIGAGNFARTLILPQLKSMGGVTLRTVVTKRGASAEHSQNAFGFAVAGTETELVLDDPAINAVLIATRHGNHAELTARALAAGKSVLVEKPLALSRAQLAQVVDARNQSDGFFQVGFNRRFAPQAIRMRDQLAAKQGPRFLVARINAGAVPPESWLNAADDGGGRVLGEVCHFVDLARFLVGSPIVSVSAEAAQVQAGLCDDLGISLRFADGSLASIAYTALGDTAFSKERFEGFAGGAVVTLDNFRELTTVEGGRTQTDKAAQDKGFKQALAAFVKAVQTGGPAPIDEAQLVESSLATICVLESLQNGRRIDL